MLIFLPLALTLNEEVLATEGRPLTADFSTVKGDGFRLTEAMTDAAILASSNLLFCLRLQLRVLDQSSSVIIVARDFDLLRWHVAYPVWLNS